VSFDTGLLLACKTKEGFVTYNTRIVEVPLNRIAKQTTRVSMAALLAVMAGEVVGRADVVQSTVILPPPNGAYTLGQFCLSNPSIGLDRCLENIVVSDFVTTSDTEVGGNEVVTATAGYSAD
jgi:hypothetical protein